MTTEQGNILIAKFMGGKPMDINNLHGKTIYEFPQPMPTKTNECGWPNKTKTGYFYFDLSWDWLMPVVENIKNIVSDEGIEIDRQLLSESGCLIMNLNIHAPKKTVWKEVVKFIEWFNSQPTQQ